MTSKSNRDGKKGVLSEWQGEAAHQQESLKWLPLTMSYCFVWLFFTASSIFSCTVSLVHLSVMIKGRRQQLQLSCVGKIPLGNDEKHLTVAHTHTHPQTHTTHGAGEEGHIHCTHKREKLGSFLKIAISTIRNVWESCCALGSSPCWQALGSFLTANLRGFSHEVHTVVRNGETASRIPQSGSSCGPLVIATFHC